MWKDSIVEETRKLRAEYAKSQEDNPEKIFNDIRKRQNEPGKHLVSFPPRKPKSKTRSA